MIKIAKGNKVTIVPEASFENFFKNNGWEVVNNKTTPAKVIKEEPVEEVIEEVVKEPVEESTSTEDEWDEAIEEEFEKPLSEMSKSELKKKAESLGIDISAGYTTSQLRDLIREANN